MEIKVSSEEKLEGNCIFSAWLLQNRKVSDLINRLSDDDLKKDIVPGRNSGLYLLGHLIASNDMLMPLFGFGEKVYPEYEKIFLCMPDKCTQNGPSPTQVRSDWFSLNEKLRSKFSNSMKEDLWMSSGDLSSKRIRIMLSIVNHQCYHLGQLSLLL